MDFDTTPLTDTSALRAQLEEARVVHVRSLLPLESIAIIRTELDNLFQRFDSLPSKYITNADGNSSNHIREIAKLVIVNQFFRESDVYKRCFNMASVLFERECYYGHDEAIYKSPGSQPVQWHQDQAYSKYDKAKQCLTFWIPLQPTDSSNGGMEYVTDHHAGLLEHKPLSDESFMVQLSNPLLDGAARLRPKMALGDVCIHTPLSIHRSVPNNSNATRRAWAIQFNKYGKSRFIRWQNIRAHINQKLNGESNDRP